MEGHVIDTLEQCETIEGTRRLNGLSWDETFGIMRRAVERGKDRKGDEAPKIIGVDEKAYKKLP